ncbi:MAG: hypothetical protein HXK82_07470 [Lachnospiraceae bacterium]|nr:hypothetical protein [Lachnospiraceae bacterium]
MPLIFCIWIGMVILAFVVWKKADIGTQIKKILQLIVCTITWICLFYHLVSIAHYVDESGEKIKNIMGNYGLGLLWVSIVSFSIYLFYLYIDFFFKKSN